MSAQHILVIEDNEDLLVLLREFLMELGYSVTAVADAEKGRAAFDAGSFSLVLCDVRLSDGQSGLDLLVYFKQKRSTPVILMTGFNQLLEVSDGKDIGADGFLKKPFSRADLEIVLSKVMSLATSLPMSKQDVIREVADVESTFQKLTLDQVPLAKPVLAEVFMRLSPTRFVRVLAIGEALTSEQSEEYRNKGLRDFFIAKGAKIS